MNQLRFLTAILLLPIAAGMGQSFEGIMTFRVTGQRGAQEFLYSAKGEKVRMDMEPAPGMTMVMLVDMRRRSVTVVRDDAKMFFEMNMDEMNGPPEMNQRDISITKTGKKEVILGYACEQMLITTENRTTEVWVTRGLGRFVQVNLNPRARSPVMRKLEEEFIDQGFFPLRIVNKDSANEEESTMEVLKIEKKSLSEDLFAVPAGYQRMEMPPLPKQ